MISTTHYRGYIIVHDQVGSDIWYGTDFICSVSNFDQAKKTIDEWVEGAR